MLIFKHMCVASDSRTTVVVMLLFVENEYEIGITVRSLGVSGVTLMRYQQLLIKFAKIFLRIIRITVWPKVTVQKLYESAE